MPGIGPYSVSVPGTVHGWEALLEKEGTISLADALEPAIGYAENGYPVSDIIAYQWQQQEDKLGALPSGQEMLNNGRAPREGELMRLPTLATTLRTVAEGGSEAFYNGPPQPRQCDWPALRRPVRCRCRHAPVALRSRRSYPSSRPASCCW